MKKISIFLTVIAFLAWTCPAMGQASVYGELCQFININKTVKAKIGTGDDTNYQRNSIQALWPVMLNGKECPKLQEAICHWLTGKDGIKNMNTAIESALYTDCEDRPFGEGGPYIIVDDFDEEISSSISSCTIELQSLGNRFALYHLLFNKYFAGAAHGMYGHYYITYDTQRDHVVTLEDILIDPELIRPHILKSIELKYQYTADDLFLPEDNTPNLPDVFYFEGGFLHLVYQVYEIASFAQGVIDVPFFYHYNEEYADILTPYGKEVMRESFLDDLY
jgi:hypothetical protein